MQRPHPANPRLTGEDRRHDAQRGAGVDHRVQVDLAGQGTEGHVLDHRHRPHARDQRRFAGAPRTAHRLEGYGREVLAFRNGVGHVQGTTATRLESETPFQLLVHRFGVLVRGQHRALLGLRSVQLDQEPLAWVWSLSSSRVPCISLLLYPSATLVALYAQRLYTQVTLHNGKSTLGKAVHEVCQGCRNTGKYAASTPHQPHHTI